MTKIKFEIQDLAARALIPVQMLKRLKVSLHQLKNEVIYLLGISVLDVCITNLDAQSNIHQKSEAVLPSHEREKKKKYLQVCLDQRHQFFPFVVSCDGVVGNEAK